MAPGESLGSCRENLPSIPLRRTAPGAGETPRVVARLWGSRTDARAKRFRLETDRGACCLRSRWYPDDEAFSFPRR